MKAETEAARKAAAAMNFIFVDYFYFDERKYEIRLFLSPTLSMSLHLCCISFFFGGRGIALCGAMTFWEAELRGRKIRAQDSRLLHTFHLEKK